MVATGLSDDLHRSVTEVLHHLWRLTVDADMETAVDLNPWLPHVLGPPVPISEALLGPGEPSLGTGSLASIEGRETVRRLLLAVNDGHGSLSRSGWWVEERRAEVKECTGRAARVTLDLGAAMCYRPRGYGRKEDNVLNSGMCLLCIW